MHEHRGRAARVLDELLQAVRANGRRLEKFLRALYAEGVRFGERYLAALIAFLTAETYGRSARS
jgi:predicted patatin/cPLA2 family phospholipase